MYENVILDWLFKQCSKCFDIYIPNDKYQTNDFKYMHEQEERGILEYSGSGKAFIFDDDRRASLFIRSRIKKAVSYAISNSEKTEEVRFHSYFNSQCDDAN